jgi:hypothetical protein
MLMCMLAGLVAVGHLDAASIGRGVPRPYDGDDT